MIRIGITGSLASGKSTVAKIISKGKYPIFSADKTVANLYKRKSFQKRLTKIFNLQKKIVSFVRACMMHKSFPTDDGGKRAEIETRSQRN